MTQINPDSSLPATITPAAPATQASQTSVLDSCKTAFSFCRGILSANAEKISEIATVPLGTASIIGGAFLGAINGVLFANVMAKILVSPLGITTAITYGVYKISDKIFATMNPKKYIKEIDKNLEYLKDHVTTLKNILDPEGEYRSHPSVLGAIAVAGLSITNSFLYGPNQLLETPFKATIAITTAIGTYSLAKYLIGALMKMFDKTSENVKSLSEHLTVETGRNGRKHVTALISGLAAAAISITTLSYTASERHQTYKHMSEEGHGLMSSLFVLNQAAVAAFSAFKILNLKKARELVGRALEASLVTSSMLASYVVTNVATSGFVSGRCIGCIFGGLYGLVKTVEAIKTMPEFIKDKLK